MKQVDFYLISNQVADARYKLASRLSNKLARQDNTALVITDSADTSQNLDDIMWSISGTSFVAHDRLGSVEAIKTKPPLSKIHIAEADNVTADNFVLKYDVLINLATEIPAYSHHFDRIAEIVEADETAKSQARLRFKSYRDEGFELKTHNIEL